MPNPTGFQVFGNRFGSAVDNGVSESIINLQSIVNGNLADISPADHLKLVLNDIHTSVNAIVPLPEFLTVDKITSIVNNKQRDRWVIEIDSELSEGFAVDEA